MATKEELEERLSEEERARAQLESLMKTMLDNRVSENQKQFLDHIKAQENVIQAEVQRMQQMKGSLDSFVKVNNTTTTTTTTVTTQQQQQQQHNNNTTQHNTTTKQQINTKVGCRKNRHERGRISNREYRI